MVTRAAARRMAWGVMLAALALAVASHDTTPPDIDAATTRAAVVCAATLHARGITPAPGGCEPRP
jgi:hypothetical protein